MEKHLLKRRFLQESNEVLMEISELIWKALEVPAVVKDYRPGLLLDAYTRVKPYLEYDPGVLYGLQLDREACKAFGRQLSVVYGSDETFFCPSD